MLALFVGKSDKDELRKPTGGQEIPTMIPRPGITLHCVFTTPDGASKPVSGRAVRYDGK